MLRGIVLCVLACVMAFGVPVQAQMSIQSCQSGWLTLLETMRMPSKMRDAEVRVTPTGSCQVRGGQAGIKASDFSQLRWRVDPVDAETVYQVEFDDIDIRKSFGLRGRAGRNLPLAQIRMAARQDVQAQRFTLEAARIDLGDLGRVFAKGKLSGVDLSNAQTTQMSVGAARVHELHIKIIGDALGGILMPTIQANNRDKASMLARNAVDQFIDAMPMAILPRSSRTALTTASRALPNARGKLRVVATSDRGLGALQIAMGANAMDAAEKEAMSRGVADNYGPAIAQMLDGVVLNITWEPSGE